MHPKKAQKAQREKSKRGKRNKTESERWQRAKQTIHQGKILPRGQTERNGNSNAKGLSAISVVSLNPDHFITDEVQQDITQQLIKHKIHIAIIQETHIPHNTNHIVNGYRIINSSEIPNPKKTQNATYQENT